MDLRVALDRVFPFARGMEVTLPLTDDGSFIAEMVLPVKHGETVLQLYRFPNDAKPLFEERLKWTGAHQRASAGRGRWAFFVAWDGTASEDEVRELVSRRVAAHPILGDPGHDGYGRPTLQRTRDRLRPARYGDRSRRSPGG